MDNIQIFENKRTTVTYSCVNHDRQIIVKYNLQNEVSPITVSKHILHNVFGCGRSKTNIIIYKKKYLHLEFAFSLREVNILLTI